MGLIDRVAAHELEMAIRAGVCVECGGKGTVVQGKLIEFHWDGCPRDTRVAWLKGNRAKDLTHSR